MRSRWLALVMCALLMVTGVPPPTAARAQDGPAATAEGPPVEEQPVIGDGADIERWDWGKFFTYAGCGAAIVSATGGIGLVAVGIACGRAASLYWNT
jgi:hypothetical protein